MKRVTNMNLNEYQRLPIEQRLDVFLKTLSRTNRTPEYYVNWDKVTRETKHFELELHTLNFLIGKDNIVETATHLFQQQPTLLRAIPSLIASREKVLDVLSVDGQQMVFEQLDFTRIDTDRIPDYVDFIDKTGLFHFLQYHAHQSLVDYVYGVEAGLDSNARKNRSGTTMEHIVEQAVAAACKESDLKFKEQATASYIWKQWGIRVPVDKSERRFDIAVFSQERKKLWVIETNYYGGGGSKLKAVAGEFTELSQFISTSPDDVTFVWVTDGQGWHTARLPLLEAFSHISNVFNLAMLQERFFEALFTE